jgi:hypothetical protein
MRLLMDHIIAAPHPHTCSRCGWFGVPTMDSDTALINPVTGQVYFYLWLCANCATLFSYSFDADGGTDRVEQ